MNDQTSYNFFQWLRLQLSVIKVDNVCAFKDIIPECNEMNFGQEKTFDQLKYKMIPDKQQKLDGSRCRFPCSTFLN